VAGIQSLGYEFLKFVSKYFRRVTGMPRGKGAKVQYLKVFIGINFHDSESMSLWFEAAVMATVSLSYPWLSFRDRTESGHWPAITNLRRTAKAGRTLSAYFGGEAEFSAALDEYPPLQQNRRLTANAQHSTRASNEL
jgi:hypothetical protein